jgi:hypothetical protein
MATAPQRYPVKLTPAQRAIVAEIMPGLADRLRLGETSQRTIAFTRAELELIRKKASGRVRRGGTGMVRNSLRHVVDLTAQALGRSCGIGAILPAKRLYEFKISLKDAHPPIWRRILVRDGTLDKLHEHVQTAMGWTNSHLHRFQVGNTEYGDPDLLDATAREYAFEDSTGTKMSSILPKTGKRLRILYEYDFGDGWMHEVVFEGTARAEPGGRYPVCVAGARACPPEDVGGVPGYEEYLAALADPDHERHEEFLGWRGRFDPEAFDATTATKRMRRGLPDWRSGRWV